MTDPVLKDAAAPGARRKLQVNSPVFYISAAPILAFALFRALFPNRAGLLFDAQRTGIESDFGWFYISAVGAFLISSSSSR